MIIEVGAGGYILPTTRWRVLLLLREVESRLEKTFRGGGRSGTGLRLRFFMTDVDWLRVEGVEVS